jgi:hypothetical protein
MDILKVEFEGRVIEFDYFVDTISIGEIESNPIFNIYSIFPKDDQTKDIVGEHFHILHETSHQFELPFRFPLSNARLPDMGKKEQDLKQAIIYALSNM